MSNSDLIALNNKIFEAMEYIQDREIKGDNLREEIARQLAFNELAKTAVANSALIAKTTGALDQLVDYEVIVESLPLLPIKKKGSGRQQIADSQVIPFNEELNYKPPKRKVN